jgi:predicted dehydrogenase
VAICEVNDSLRNQIADRYGITESYRSLAEALERDFHLAIIATPAPFHVPQAEQLVSRGTHVLIEKPLSTTTEGIEQLRGTIVARKLVAAVAYPYRAHPALYAMRTAIASGRFGAPLQVTVVAGQSFPKYRPAFRDTYYRSRETGGGAIQDALTHLINAVEWIVGPTERVVGDAARLKLDGVSVEDTTHVLARNGQVLTSYSLNQHQPANETSLTLVCEAGQARFEYHRNRWSWIVEPDSEWQEESFGELQRDEVFQRQANSFLDAVERGSPPLCTLDEGEATLRTVLAILKSLESDRWESVDPLLKDGSQR